MSSAHEPRLRLEIGHILFLDIVGFSKLLADEQQEILRELNNVVRHTTEFRTAEAQGKLIRLPTGDGMVLVFSNNAEAPVECAVEISRELRAHPKLKLRMGIHSGPVNPVADVNDQSNLAGAGINVAQRVMSCGDAGHILLSKRFAEDLEQYAEWQACLHDVGEVEVKHGARLALVSLYTNEVGNPQLPQKVARTRVAYRSKVSAIVGLAVLGFVAFAYYRSLRHKLTENTADSASSVSAKSIAVLPFENRSEEKANVYFADGIQDEILTRLSKIADLKVISRTSTQQYKSTPENLPDIARQLGVAHILEGSVQKSGDVVRVNVQLIKAASDAHLWAETFDRKLTDVFLVESDVAKAIADQLQAHLSGREQEVIAAKPTDNPAAYDAYLHALTYMVKAVNTPANALGAQKYLREAVRLDPNFALSWALLSFVDARGYVTTALQPTVALREEARQAAKTALVLQPNLGEAMLANGYFHYACIKDYDTALHYYEQARQLLPNSSQVPELLAYVTRRRGEWEHSDSYFKQAEQLDPRNVNLLTQHAVLHVALRHFPEALRKFDQVLSITPDDIDTLVLKAAVAQAEGDLPRASAILTPLHPAANDAGAVETQVYQAILERRPAAMITQLQDILAQSDRPSGYVNGELRFWLGWSQEMAGDHAGAQESWQQARNELEPFLKEQPDNDILIGDLALINSSMGDKAAALALAERAIAANPMEKDAVAGPAPMEIIARVAARFGESDRAIAALQKLLAIPYAGPLATQEVPLTPALLQLDPMFAPLRTDPRFQKLLASSSPK